MDISVLDLGSHSFQLLCARASRFGNIERLHKDVEYVQLIRHVTATGEIDARGIEEGIQGTKRLIARAPEFARKKRLIAVGTSAIREASNGKAFLDRLAQETGIHAKAISGEQVAHFAFLGAALEFGAKNRRIAVVDLGGGATEMAWGTGKQVVHATSVHLGIIGLVERLAQTPNTANVALDLLAAFVRRTLEPAIRSAQQPPPELLVFASGVARVVQGLIASYDLGIAGTPITTRALRSLIPRVLDAPSSELEARGVPPARVKTAGPTAIVLDVVCELFEKDEFTVASGGVREGIAFSARTLQTQAWPG